MQRYYDTIAEFDRDGFHIIVDRTWEDINPRDHFEEEGIEELCSKIDDGTYEWFMLRVRVLAEGLELGSHYLGGCLYEEPNDVMNDGTAEDCIYEAMREAKDRVYELANKFTALSHQLDREGVEHV